MPAQETKYFGRLEYGKESLIYAPRGVPGFDAETAFVLIQMPDQFPLVYVQSTVTPDLCFVALPILTLVQDYSLTLDPADAEQLEVALRPGIGTEVLCLALITVHESGPTANLLAPLVVNLRTRDAAQCINTEPGYSHQQPLFPVQGAAA